MLFNFYRAIRPLSRPLGLMMQMAARRPALLTLPFIMLQQPAFSCFFGFGSPKKATNKMDQRVHSVEYQANNPIEDRMLTHQLKNIDGFVAAVFDGHGGWQMSNYAMRQLSQALEKAFQSNKGKYQTEEELVTASIKQAFSTVENNFLKVARDGYKLGFPRMGRVGSCALVVLVVNDKVYAANAGDSQALLIQKEQTKPYSYVKLNKKLNACSKKEQARLKALFPNESDIVVCKKNNPKSCYVKERLQPTRALGDFRLKYPQFNNPQEISRDRDYQSKIKVFTGPYITHEPEIRVIPLKKSHKCIVIGCDGNIQPNLGLWDELSKQEVTNIVGRNIDNKKLRENSKILLQQALEKAALNSNLSLGQLKKIPPGQQRRRLHDDISIITIDLQNQLK